MIIMRSTVGSWIIDERSNWKGIDRVDNGGKLHKKSSPSSEVFDYIENHHCHQQNRNMNYTKKSHDPHHFLTGVFD